jgi:signal transduction histidine kinase
MRFFYVLLLCVTIGITTNAQTSVIAALSNKVQQAKNEEEKLTAILALCEEHASMHKDSLYHYATLAKQLAANSKSQLNKSLASIAMINAWLRKNKTDSAIVLIEPELKINTLADPATRSIYFKLAALKVDCYGDASNYKDALSELYSIINDAEKYKDSLVLAKNMNTIGVINYNLDHVPEAFDWYFKALHFTTAAPRFYGAVATLYINLSETYRWVQKKDSAEYYINKAIPLCEQTENLFFLANALRVKANIFKQAKDYVQAEQTILQCIAIRAKTEGKLSFSNEQMSLASIYMRSGKADNAIKILTDAIALDDAEKKAGNTADVDPLKISYYNTLANCYQLKGDTKQYAATLEKLIAAKDAFYAANSARAIAELQTKYEVQKKENTIIQQKLDITQKNYLFYGSLLFLLFAVIISWVLFKTYRRRQKLRMQQAVKEEKLLTGIAVKEAEENERKRIAADLHDNLGAYAASIVSNLDQIAMQQQLQPTAVAPLQELRNNSQSMVAQLSDTIWALKKDALSLTAISDRLKVFIQRIQPSYPDIMIDVMENIAEDKLLPPSQAFHLFRIVQEAVINALKHSRCKNILVQINNNAQWEIKVKDDGKGFDSAIVASSSNGLLNMKNRAKEFGWQVQWEFNEPGTMVIIKPAG